MPPESETFMMLEPGLGAKTMTPLGDQLPPRDPATAASVCTGPPEASILRSLPFEKKPIERLSNDQNIWWDASVAASGCAVAPLSGRTNKTGAVAPVGSALNASSLPFGDNAGTSL